MENYKQGIFFGLAAYVLWGILPVYWKALELVSPFEILSSRFMWSCVFVFLLIIFQKKWPLFAKEVKQVFSNVKAGAAMVAAGITISFNLTGVLLFGLLITGILLKQAWAIILIRW